MAGEGSSDIVSLAIVWRTRGKNILLFSSSGSLARRTSSYLMGLIFLQVLDQIWALQMLMVRMKSPMATLVRGLREERVVTSESRERISENTIMKNWSSATDIITKLMAVA